MLSVPTGRRLRTPENKTAIKSDQESVEKKTAVAYRLLWEQSGILSGVPSWSMLHGQELTCQPKNITVTQRAPRRLILPLLPCNPTESYAVCWSPFAKETVRTTVVFLIRLIRRQRHIVDSLLPAWMKDLEDLKKMVARCPHCGSLEPQHMAHASTFIVPFFERCQRPRTQARTQA